MKMPMNDAVAEMARQRVQQGGHPVEIVVAIRKAKAAEPGDMEQEDGEMEDEECCPMCGTPKSKQPAKGAEQDAEEED